MTDERAAVGLKVKTWIPCIDTFMDGGVEHVNAYMREHEAGEHVLLRDYVALRAENTELSARVSELTRMIAEAETAIQAYFEGEHHPIIEGVNRLIIEANGYSDAVIEWKARAIKAEFELEERALQSGERGKG